jgi:hypothetical protein
MKQPSPLLNSTRAKSFGGIVLGGIGWLAYSRYPQFFGGFDKTLFVMGCAGLGGAFEKAIHWALGVNTPGPPSFIEAYRKVIIAKVLLTFNRIDKAAFKEIEGKAFKEYFFPEEKVVKRLKRRTPKKQLTQ